MKPPLQSDAVCARADTATAIIRQQKAASTPRNARNCRGSIVVHPRDRARDAGYNCSQSPFFRVRDRTRLIRGCSRAHSRAFFRTTQGRSLISLLRARAAARADQRVLKIRGDWFFRVRVRPAISWFDGFTCQILIYIFCVALQNYNGTF